MKIPQAKEILTGMLKALTGEEHAALKLALQALGDAAFVELPLPGETEEVK